MADSFYQTNCISWSSITGGSYYVSIPSSAYTPIPSPDITPISAPLPLNLSIIRTETIDSKSYNLFFSNSFRNQEAVATITFVSGPTGLPNYITTLQSLPSLDVNFIPLTGNTDFNSPFDSIATWIDGQPTNFLPGEFDNGDTYTITPRLCSGSSEGVSVIFSRDLGLNLNDIGNTGPTGGIETSLILGEPTNINMQMAGQGYCGCQNNVNCDKVIVPIITIEGQTTYNGQYLSDMLFTIKDKYCYYEYDPCLIKNPNKKCCTLYLKEKKLKTTTFLEFNPPLQDVVKGCGKTLRAKVMNYFDKHPGEFGPSFNDFYVLLIKYSMAKYILAKLIYGDFNITYLCRNFNKQFFKDLKQTRFCGFIDFFDNPVFTGFDKIFIKCDQTC
jgi:hypothetical protein